MTDARRIGDGPDDAIRAVLAVLRSGRFSLSNEKDTQAGIADALTTAGIAFEREHRLGPGDIVDFLVPPHGIAVEVKLAAGNRRMAVFRQLERYAAHQDVRAIVLATNMAMGLPAEVGGKPAYYASLGGAWM